MKHQILSPTMEHGKEADLSSQMLGVGRDGLQGIGGGLEEDAIDNLLVLVGDGGDLLWHGEHNMKILDVEKLGLTILDPLHPGQTLAFWTVSIPATIEGIPLMATMIATFEVAAQSSRAAHLDCGHDASLRAGHRRAMLLSISFAVAAEHVRHFQLWTVHSAGYSEVLRWGRLRCNRNGAREQIEWTRGEQTLLVAMRR